MKKFLIGLATIAFVGLSISGCPATAPSGANPGASSNPGNGTTGTGTTIGGTLDSKANFIAFMNCVKTKNPSISIQIDSTIAVVNALTDAQWAASSIGYKAGTEAFATTYGCK